MGVHSDGWNLQSRKLSTPAQGTKKQKNKPLDAPNLHAPKKTKTKSEQLIRKQGHRCGSFVFCFFWRLCRFGDGCTLVSLFFGACAGLVSLLIRNIRYLQYFVCLITTSISTICFSPGFQGAQMQKTDIYNVL